MTRSGKREAHRSPVEELMLECRPIGVIHSPWNERREAPRQSAVSRAEGSIELFSGRGFEHALSDLERFSHVWVLFWFHLNQGYTPKVLPPRSAERRGLFATRSPYRPNPIGMSVLELTSVEGLTVKVRCLDMLDGTPVLDLKPYVAYTDAVPDAAKGWLEGALDPLEPFQIAFEGQAVAALAYLRDSFGVELEPPIREVLALGPQAHPYRRIRRAGGGYVLAVKAWRARFTTLDRTITVSELRSGYRPRELVTNPDPALDQHRAFVEKFGH